MRPHNPSLKLNKRSKNRLRIIILIEYYSFLAIFILTHQLGRSAMTHFLKSLIILSSSLLLVPVSGFAGTLTTLNNGDVKSTFTDKTITTISAATLDGTLISDSFTGYFSKDGKMMGNFAKKPDGEPQNDTGTWHVNSDKLCFKWDHWNGNKEKCVSVYKLKNAFLIINDQNGFESLIMDKDIVSGNRLSNAVSQ